MNRVRAEGQSLFSPAVPQLRCHNAPLSNDPVPTVPRPTWDPLREELALEESNRERSSPPWSSNIDMSVLHLCLLVVFRDSSCPAGFSLGTMTASLCCNMQRSLQGERLAQRPSEWGSEDEEELGGPPQRGGH
ncbi:hypothetical protein EYF80_060404 [Liparis tanakae]|uniref:Uncharacterized protein n=1 Tax=Liparis tanakae TaxID=230148 RepID=A0A4Z2EL43_9TELE|nr:hypothetical protein EYF80_060404 [Liparis tanakae]